MTGIIAESVYFENGGEEGVLQVWHIWYFQNEEATAAPDIFLLEGSSRLFGVGLLA